MSGAVKKPLVRPIGWHSRGYLPHFEASEIVQTVAIRLADSLPEHVRDTRRPLLPPAEELDTTLDAGRGQCWLRRPDIARLVENTLLHFDAERYQLLAWCVMPNHVHIMVEMRVGFRLGDQVKSWKTFSARLANRVLGRTGAFWSPDFFDRYIRSERHYGAALAYIENNPVTAGLVRRAELWPWSSARFR
jgi:REP element-mobilizing transposase RayT